MYYPVPCLKPPLPTKHVCPSTEALWNIKSHGKQVNFLQLVRSTNTVHIKSSIRKHGISTKEIQLLPTAKLMAITFFFSDVFSTDIRTIFPRTMLQLLINQIIRYMEKGSTWCPHRWSEVHLLRFTVVFSRACGCTLTRITRIQSTPSHIAISDLFK